MRTRGARTCGARTPACRADTLVGICLLSLLFVAPAFLAAQSPKPKLPGEDWVSLFNGKDLKGWVPVGNEKWDVESGTIHGQAMTKGYGYLRTEKNFKDFHLSLRFKCEGDGNSGVFFHV